MWLNDLFCDFTPAPNFFSEANFSLWTSSVSAYLPYGIGLEESNANLRWTFTWEMKGNIFLLPWEDAHLGSGGRLDLWTRLGVKSNTHRPSSSELMPASPRGLCSSGMWLLLAERSTVGVECSFPHTALPSNGESVKVKCHTPGERGWPRASFEDGRGQEVGWGRWRCLNKRQLYASRERGFYSISPRPKHSQSIFQ